MIFGTGIDLVRIKRIEKTVVRWGERFVNRVYTPGEARHCYSRVSPFSAFALRFAAKEAFSKALGLGMRKGVRWKDIEIFTLPSGKPGIRVYGVCAEICNRNEITGTHLSLSDEGEYGAAMVVLEKAS